MQITLISFDPHVALLISLFPFIDRLFATDLQVPSELISGTSPKFSDPERIRNGSEEALVGSALVLARGCRK